MHKGEEMLNHAQENATEAQAASVQVKPGIDYEKLKSIGVPDEVIASLDPRDGGNITPQGGSAFLGRRPPAPQGASRQAPARKPPARAGNQRLHHDKGAGHNAKNVGPHP